jgi:hypothetical protein
MKFFRGLSFLTFLLTFKTKEEQTSLWKTFYKMMSKILALASELLKDRQS